MGGAARAAVRPLLLLSAARGSRGGENMSGRRTGWLALGVLFLGLWGSRAILEGPVPRAAGPPRPDLDYVRWLEERSMLYQAREQAALVSGTGVQWRNPYGRPRPREVVKRSSVWVLDYPGSVIVRPGSSVIATWADPDLWDAFKTLGVDLLHTGPVKRAGGIVGRKYTPTLDGWFDRISLEIDPQLGTEEQYRRLVRTARSRGGLVAGDLVPLHTGTGADFRLAQRAYSDYPGMYTMVEVRREDWHLLPRVKGPWAAALVPRES